MPLDPQAQKVVDALAALNLKPVEESTPEEARESMRSRTAALGPVEDVAAVADHRVPVAGGDIAVRVYSPGGAGPHPALVFYHGGGWVIGDLVTHDGVCRSLANAARCVVASVDYRLAPEHATPSPPRIRTPALQWVARPTRRSSASIPGAWPWEATARAATWPPSSALMARDRRGPAARSSRRSSTRSPTTTSTPRPTARTPTGYVLTREGMRWFLRHYLAREEQGREPYASPLRASSLAGLPPALVITAECDPLRDEGEAYAARLRDAGVPVTVTRYPGMFHGFLRMTNILDKAKAARDEIAGALRKAFA